MLASHTSNNDDINCATEIVKWELLHTGHLSLYEETKAGRLVFSGKVKLMIIKNSVWGLGSYSLLLSIITCSFNRNNQRDRSTKKSSTFITTYYRDFYSWGKHENKWFNLIKCLMISFFLHSMDFWSLKHEGKGNAGGRVSCSWTFEFCDYSEGSSMSYVSWVSEWVVLTHSITWLIFVNTEICSERRKERICNTDLLRLVKTLK